METLRETKRDFTEVEHCWIQMPDGVRLSARLWLPKGCGVTPAPAILEYIPYRKCDMVRQRDERNHDVFAGAGYACIRVDMRGSGNSEGVMEDMYTEDELNDAIAVIEWIASQPWCDGKIGMMGTSWGGTASLQAASRCPPALKAVIAVCATNNRYEDDIHHMGGLVLTDSVEWGATLPAIQALPPDPQQVGKYWRKIWLERLEKITSPLEHWIREETCNAYWQWGSVSHQEKVATCPVLMVGGWADRYSNTVFNYVRDNPDTSWGIVGPWGHHYPSAASPQPGIDFQQEAIRWWDHWLRGADNGTAQIPKLRVWMQEFHSPVDKIQRRPGSWITEPHWPSKNVHRVEYSLTDSGGLCRRASCGGVRQIPLNLRVGVAAGDTGYFGRDGGLPLDQQTEDDNSLVFETSAFTEATSLLGSVELEFDQIADAACVVVRLSDISVNGEVSRICYGVRNLVLSDNFKEKRAKGAMCKVALHNTAYQIKPGHRLRLSLSTSYWPIVWPAKTWDPIEIQLDQVRLLLPLRVAQDESTVWEFESPREYDRPDVYDPKTDPALERQYDFDQAIVHAVTAWYQPLRRVLNKQTGIVFSSGANARHSIKVNDPLSAKTEYQVQLGFEQDGVAVEVNSSASLRADEHAWFPDCQLEVIENGKTVLKRRWNVKIDRKN